MKAYYVWKPLVFTKVFMKLKGNKLHKSLASGDEWNDSLILHIRMCTCTSIPSGISVAVFFFFWSGFNYVFSFLIFIFSWLDLPLLTKTSLFLFSNLSLICYLFSILYMFSVQSPVISHFPFVVLEYGSQICIWSPWAQMYFRIFKIFYNRDHYVIY